MDTQQFSNEFDILLNNVTSNQAAGLNEYEKSVFLTKAQKMLLTEYFNQRVDQVGGGFDGSQKRQYDFSSLIKTASLLTTSIDGYTQIDKRSKCYLFPYDYFLSVNEMLADSKYQYNVMPIDYNEYSRLMMKPYAYPVKKGAWRLITGRKKNFVSSHEGYFMQALANVSLSITYVRLAQYSDGDRWYTVSDKDVEGAHPAGSHLPERPYLDIETGEGDAVNPSNPKMYCITYQGKAFHIQVDHENDYSAYYVYLYELVDETYSLPSLSDYEVAEILRLAFPALQENEVEIPGGTTIKVKDLLKDFYDRFGDLSTLEVPELVYKFRKFWTDFDGYPGDEILDDEGEVIGYKPEKPAYTFRFDPSGTLPIVEIIGRFASSPNYTLRYIKKPSPIILVDLTDAGYEDLSIDGVSEVSECELPEETHQEILERAVTLAKIAWAGGTATQAANQREK